jgi:transposase-like protein
VRGKRGGGYAEIVPNASKHTLQAIIRGKADSILHANGWRGYDGLVDMGFDKHFHINHSNNEFARGTNHVNGIESFGSFAKRRLAKFNGIARHTFALHTQRV